MVESFSISRAFVALNRAAGMIVLRAAGVQFQISSFNSQFAFDCGARAFLLREQWNKAV
jgi:hypothetical protein